MDIERGLSACFIKLTFSYFMNLFISQNGDYKMNSHFVSLRSNGEVNTHTDNYITMSKIE